MSLIIRNHSKRYSDLEVRRLVKFAVGDVDMSKCCVKVYDDARTWRGRAYSRARASTVPPSCTQQIFCRLPPESLYPFGGQYKKRSAPFRLENWREALVYLAAHEAKHIDQFNERDRGHKVPLSELRCEAHAAMKLAQYRLALAAGGTVLIAARNHDA